MEGPPSPTARPELKTSVFKMRRSNFTGGGVAGFGATPPPSARSILEFLWQVYFFCRTGLKNWGCPEKSDGVAVLIGMCSVSQNRHSGASGDGEAAWGVRFQVENCAFSTAGTLYLHRFSLFFTVF